MTKPERTKVLKAISLLMGDECQLHRAVDLLGSMVGVKTAVSMVQQTGTLDLRGVGAMPKRPFRWKGPK